MSSAENLVENVALVAAVENNEINAVQKFLDKGANPNYRNESGQSLISLAIKKNHGEIVKLLLKHGAIASLFLMEQLFDSELSSHAKDIISHIIAQFKNPKSIKKLVKDFFTYLVESETEEPTASEVFKLLLDHELNTRDSIEYHVYDRRRDTPGEYLTALHLSVRYDRINFVSILLQRGVDVNQKTSGKTSLHLAVRWQKKQIIELLLEKGAKINEADYDGRTASHYAFSMFTDPEIIHMLLKHGADFTIMDEEGITPFSNAHLYDNEEILIKELAKSSSEDHPNCRKNFDYIEYRSDLEMTLNECFSELRKMRSCKFYNDLSLYDVLGMRSNIKKLSFLMKNKTFVEEFTSLRNRQSFEHYDKDLDVIFEKSVKMKEFLQSEEKKLFSILKNHLPQLVIHKISYLANQHLLS